MEKKEDKRKRLDVTEDICPLTFVKCKLQLEEMSEGEVLEIFLREGEAVKNVPRSLSDEGHIILSLKEKEKGIFLLTVERGE